MRWEYMELSGFHPPRINRCSAVQGRRPAQHGRSFVEAASLKVIEGGVRKVGGWIQSPASGRTSQLRLRTEGPMILVSINGGARACTQSVGSIHQTGEVAHVARGGERRAGSDDQPGQTKWSPARRRYTESCRRSKASWTGHGLLGPTTRDTASFPSIETGTAPCGNSAIVILLCLSLALTRCPAVRPATRGQAHLMLSRDARRH